MEHELCRENLSAYLDGELARDERAGLEAHLASCAGCRAELEQLKSVSGLVKKHVMEPVPPALRKAVLSPRPARPWLKPVLALSTAAAAALVVFNLRTATDGPVYSVDTFGSRTTAADLGAAATEERTTPAPQPEAVPAPAIYAPAESGGKTANTFAAAAARGSYSQAKFAAPLRPAAPSAIGAMKKAGAPLAGMDLGAAEAAAFVMRVEDVFPITGRGVVVSGRVDNGAVATGGTVHFTAPDGRKLSCKVEVQPGGKDSASGRASAGMNAALMLLGIEQDQVSRGTILFGAPR